MKKANKASARAGRWNRENPEARKKNMRLWRLRNTYGIEEEDVNFMISQQSGICAITGCENRAEEIDHDHETGKVRGLLCSRCNKLLGVARDCAPLLIEAARYLEDSRRRQLKGGRPLGPRQRNMSDPARQLLRERMIGNTWAKGHRPWNFGKPFSQETREKMKASSAARWESLGPEAKLIHAEMGRRSALKRWGGKKV